MEVVVVVRSGPSTLTLLAPLAKSKSHPQIPSFFFLPSLPTLSLPQLQLPLLLLLSLIAPALFSSSLVVWLSLSSLRELRLPLFRLV